MTNNYYQKHKEKLQKEALEISEARDQNLSEEEKDKARKKVLERYQNLTEEKKKQSNKNISDKKKKI